MPDHAELHEWCLDVGGQGEVRAVQPPVYQQGKREVGVVQVREEADGLEGDGHLAGPEQELDHGLAAARNGLHDAEARAGDEAAPARGDQGLDQRAGCGRQRQNGHRDAHRGRWRRRLQGGALQGRQEAVQPRVQPLHGAHQIVQLGRSSSCRTLMAHSKPNVPRRCSAHKR